MNNPVDTTEREGTQYPSLTPTDLREIARQHAGFLADAAGSMFRRQLAGRQIGPSDMAPIVGKLMASAPALTADIIVRGSRGEVRDAEDAASLELWRVVTILGAIIGATIRDIGVPRIQDLLLQSLLPRGLLASTAANDRVH